MLPHDVIDTERLASETFVARVEHYPSIGSTHDRAHAAAAESGPLPLLVVADEQTAGRGRGSNRWWTGRGSLAFSLVFDPAAVDLLPKASPVRSLIAATALVDTLAELAASQGAPLPALGLHWPNDVFVGSRKIAGILIDVLADGRHVLGVGLNVNNSLATAPPDVQARAATLAELTGRRYDRTQVLVMLLAHLEHALRSAAAEPEQYGQRFQQLCLQVGEVLTVDTAGRRTTGICQGIAADGALLLHTEHGPQRLYSGTLCR